MIKLLFVLTCHSRANVLYVPLIESGKGIEPSHAFALARRCAPPATPTRQMKVFKFQQYLQTKSHVSRLIALAYVYFLYNVYYVIQLYSHRIFL